MELCYRAGGTEGIVFPNMLQQERSGDVWTRCEGYGQFRYAGVRLACPENTTLSPLVFQRLQLRLRCLGIEWSGGQTVRLWRRGIVVQKGQMEMMAEVNEEYSAIDLCMRFLLEKETEMKGWFTQLSKVEHLVCDTVFKASGNGLVVACLSPRQLKAHVEMQSRLTWDRKELFELLRKGKAKTNCHSSMGHGVEDIFNIVGEKPQLGSPSVTSCMYREQCKMVTLRWIPIH